MITTIEKASDAIQKGARIINEGGLVVFPTETVYGLGANAFDERAVAKIFEAKGRPQDNPLIVHISSLEQVKDIAKDIPDKFYELASRFMPGPLTVILNKSDKIPYIVTAGGETVGARTYCEQQTACRAVRKPLQTYLSDDRATRLRGLARARGTHFGRRPVRRGNRIHRTRPHLRNADDTSPRCDNRRYASRYCGASQPKRKGH